MSVGVAAAGERPSLTMPILTTPTYYADTYHGTTMAVPGGGREGLPGYYQAPLLQHKQLVDQSRSAQGNANPHPRSNPNPNPSPNPNPAYMQAVYEK